MDDDCTPFNTIFVPKEPPPIYPIDFIKIITITSWRSTPAIWQKVMPFRRTVLLNADFFQLMFLALKTIKILSNCSKSIKT